jgi:hypothetical protein
MTFLSFLHPKDTCQCPHCGVTLEVTEYGHGLECSECHGRIDVWPEPRYFFDTPFGMIGVGRVK